MSSDLHRQCWLMLPWIITGRIAASDKLRFERHLLECAACREELEHQRVVCEQIRRDEPVMLAPQASLQKLMARIDSDVPDASEESAPTASASRLARVSPRWLAIAAAIQAIVIAALLMVVWHQRATEMSAPRFTTLSSTAAPAPSGAVLRVVFHPRMTNAELQALVRDVQASVVAGPTEAGVYTLQLTQDTAPRDITAALAIVRAHPNVVFAEHVSTEPRR